MSVSVSVSVSVLGLRLRLGLRVRVSVRVRVRVRNRDRDRVSVKNPNQDVGYNSDMNSLYPSSQMSLCWSWIGASNSSERSQKYYRHL